MNKRMAFFIVLFIMIFMFNFIFAAEVINPDKPDKGDWDLKAGKVWEVSNYGNEIMTVPSVGAVLDDGTVGVFDWKHWTNYIFDTNGKYVGSFGKQGEGPGEVKNQRNMFAGQDKFIIEDYLKLHYFSKKGKFLKSIRYTREFGFPKLMINDNEYISFPDREKFYITRVNLAKGSRRLIKEISYFKGLQIPYGDRRATIIIPGLSPKIECGFDKKNHRFFYGINDSYEIYVMNEQGFVVSRFSVKRKKRNVTNKMKKEMNKEIEISPLMWRRLPGGLAHFDKIQIEDELVLVYSIYFGDYRDEQQIDIFSPQGKYLYRTIFRPEKGEQIHSNYRYKTIIKNGFLYAALQDQDGEMKVIKYKISLPRPRVND